MPTGYYVDVHDCDVGVIVRFELDILTAAVSTAVPPYRRLATAVLRKLSSDQRAGDAQEYRAAHGQSFTVQTPDAGSVTRGTLIRLSSVTHTFNMSQLIFHLTFTAAGGSVSATAPSNPNLAPPGPYMLFLINANGVPSVAKIVRIGP
jgi:hypothetical protein